MGIRLIDSLAKFKMGEQGALEVSPTELAFKVVPDAYSTKQLRLQNRSAKNMAFKIKTTNPRQYFVRPNQGIVPPGERTVIHVMMGKLPEVPKEKCKDRFLVQSAPFDGEVSDSANFQWKAHFTDPKHKPDEIKLKCTYLTDGEAEQTNQGAGTTHAPAAVDDGLRQRTVTAKPPPMPANASPSKDTKAQAATKPAAATPVAAPTTSSGGMSTKNITPVSPPVAKSGPQWSLFLVIAVVFFLVGRYTTHIAIPGLE